MKSNFTSREASRFNLFIKVSEDQYLLYNTLTRRSAFVPPSVVGLFGWDISGDNVGSLHRSLLPGGPGSVSPHPSLRDVPESLTDSLISMGFITESWDYERRTLDETLRKGTSPDVFYPVIAYTARCNMACSYCFEEGADRQVRQTDEMTTKTLGWIDSYLQSSGPFRRVNLGLFGGEPLLDIPIAEKLIEGARAICHNREVDFEFSCTTNGTRLTRALIEDWHRRGLVFLLVTLDGPKAVHDKRRPLIGGQGTYDNILNNLVSIAEIEGLNIDLEINIDRDNIAGFEELLDDLERTGLKNRVRIIPEATLETTASSAQKDGAHHCNQHGLKGNELSEAFATLATTAFRRGFNLPEFVGTYYPCIFVQKHHVVVDWQGDFFKCSFTLGNDGMKVGSITEDFNKRNDELLGAVRVVEQCKERECAYIPICGGGCRYESWNETGLLEEMNCKAEFIDRLAPLTLTHFYTGNLIAQNRSTCQTCSKQE